MHCRCSCGGNSASWFHASTSLHTHASVIVASWPVLEFTSQECSCSRTTVHFLAVLPFDPWVGVGRGCLVLLVRQPLGGDATATPGSLIPSEEDVGNTANEPNAGHRDPPVDPLGMRMQIFNF